MNKDRTYRIVAVLIGAAVLFGIDTGLGVSLYIAIPAGLIAYIATLVGFAMLAANTTAK